MAKNTGKNEPTPHSKFHWLLITLAVILGIPGVIGIYIWISNHIVSSVRIPVILLIFPLLLFIAIAGVIDDAIIEKAPQLVRNKDRYLLAQKLGHDPITGAPLGPPLNVGGYAPAQGSGIPGTAAYGPGPQSQDQAGMTPQSGYGQAPANQAVQGYGQMPAGSQPAAPGYLYGQTMPAQPDGQGQAGQGHPGQGYGQSAPQGQPEAYGPYGYGAPTA
ncbi:MULTISPECIES: hypothetical protein [unclassified Actinomyces]|uniref:hypothetical protein n=1 Tax=unclassified Actinomyces TaxID=2609248 RepID=UPI0013A6E6C7|nr:MULTISPECIES: hypothetical protein [unclassified Actinomyces]MBW3069634.1 hypothetical protein [Actinomyces sp. 594]NDR54747.1 hypothetical protein [Actinomyces sp. 565]